MSHLHQFPYISSNFHHSRISDFPSKTMFKPLKPESIEVPEPPCPEDLPSESPITQLAIVGRHVSADHEQWMRYACRPEASPVRKD